MRTFIINKFEGDSVVFTRNNNGLYTPNNNSVNGGEEVGELDFLCEEGYHISSVRRSADAVDFTIGGHVKVGRRKVEILEFYILKNQCYLLLDDDENEEVPLVEAVIWTAPVATPPVTGPTTNEAFWSGLQARIVGQYPRAIKVQGLLKRRPTGETLEDFLKKFFKGSDRMTAGWNTTKPTVYADDSSVQTEPNKRRSLGDIYMICRYYYPTCTVKEVAKLLMLTLPSLYRNEVRSGFRTSRCSVINKKVWYWSTTETTHAHNQETPDEYGNIYQQYLTNLR